MEDIGAQLRQTRKRQEKSLEEVHEETRVSIEHLRLLEQNDFSFLPQTYVKSFLKTYATYLGLDADSLIVAYLEQDPSREPETEVETETTGEAKPLGDQPVVAGRSRGRHVYALPMRQFVEWALGAGFLVLLAGFVFLYVEFRSQIYAAPPDRLTYRETPPLLDLAEISLQSARGPDEISAPLQLKIVPLDHLWLQLSVDGDTTQQAMHPGANRSWLARDRFDLRIGQLARNDGTDTQPAAARQLVELTLTKDDTK